LTALFLDQGTELILIPYLNFISPMTVAEARKILGIGPDEDPRPHLGEFGNARERIAGMVRTAPNETLASLYQEGLREFDQALAVIQADLESPRRAAKPAPVPPAKEPPLEAPAEPIKPVVRESIVENRPSRDAGQAAAADRPVKTERLDEAPLRAVLAAAVPVPERPAPQPEGKRRALVWCIWLLVVIAGTAGSYWWTRQNELKKEMERLEQIVRLEREGAGFVENRRWQDALRVFAEIEALDPGSELARQGQRSIEAGMVEEQKQFVAYWTGQALAELDAGRLDEAQAAVDQVLAKLPTETQAVEIAGKIAAARAGQSRELALGAIRKHLEDRQWNEAISASRDFLSRQPDDEDVKSLLADATAAMEKQAADRNRAGELLLLAIDRDQGAFDQQALDWLREAASLDPANDEVAKRLEKMASYTRTIKVPGDFATPAEALAVARDRDRIVLAAETWKGPLFINAAVEIQGAGAGKTLIECPAAEGSPVTIGPDAKGARITGVGFRHETFLVDGTERFAAALVRGGVANFVDCRFTDASGHGLAVIEQGQVIASRCRFSDNGWNGAAALGVGSLMEIRDSESLNNFEHGIESWDGAAVILVNNRCEGNSRNGIHADNGLASATIQGNQLIGNREFGLVLSSASTGIVTGNTSRSNLLGGFVVRGAAAGLRMLGNQATLNKGPGLVLEAGLPRADYQQNMLSKNRDPQLLADVMLAHQDEKKRDAGESSEPLPSLEPEPAPLSTLPEP
jgi:hypothetical protein